MSANDSDILGISRLGNTPSGSGNRENPAPAEALTPTETRIAGIWQTALPGIPLQRDSHFIVIGGDSLSLAAVIMEIEKQYGITLSVEAIANNLTLSGMAAVVDQLSASG